MRLYHIVAIQIGETLVVRINICRVGTRWIRSVGSAIRSDHIASHPVLTFDQTIRHANVCIFRSTAETNQLYFDGACVYALCLLLIGQACDMETLRESPRNRRGWNGFSIGYDAV